MKKALSAVLAILFTVFTFTGVLPFGAGVYADGLPDAVDLTTTVHLPPIGNQGQVGCCASMSITYMQFTNAVSRYLHSIDPSIDWNPSSGDPRYCFSPRFTYNLAGAGTAWVYEILKEQGCPTQDVMPFSGGPTGYAYDNVLAKDWGATPGVWTDARNFRVKTYDQIWINSVCPDYKVTSSQTGKALIERIKTALRDGNVVVTGGYPSAWVNEPPVALADTGTYGKAGEVAIAYSTGEMSGGHQVSIVGYDDSITCKKNGVTLKGAFKLANSWGTGWYNDGYIWMMYDAFNGKDQSEFPALNASNRTWTMDQVVFLDWKTGLQIGETGLCAEITATSSDRDALSVTLTGRDRATGSTVYYQPYMFTYLRHRPNYSKELTLNYKGKKSGTATGVITVGFDGLIGRLPAGKSPDDYIWGINVTGMKQNAVTTLEKIELKKNGQTVSILSDIGDEIGYWTNKSYLLEPERGGTWSGGGWNFFYGTLTVWGKGAMDSYADDAVDRPWESLSDQITKVVIEDGVTSVGAGAFSHLPELAAVLCGKDVRAVGDGAFSSDPSLRSIAFAGPVSTVGKGTVSASAGIETVTVTGQTAEDFLAAVSVKEGNENYKNAAVSAVETEDPSVRAEGTWKKGAWSLHDGVLTVTGSGAIPNFADAFSAPWAQYSEEVTKLVIGDGITTVGARAFSQFSELSCIDCGKDVATLGVDAFSYSPVCTIVFRHKIRAIAQGAVYSCGCLQKVVLTDQTKEEFLKAAHRSNYNDAFDAALFTDIKDEPADPADYDADGSGSVTIDDVAALLDALSDGGTLPVDPDRNGRLTIRDVTMLLDYLASAT